MSENEQIVLATQKGEAQLSEWLQSIAQAIQTAQHPGARASQEDAYATPFSWAEATETPLDETLLARAGWLFIVADGVGSRQGSGQLARQATLGIMAEFYRLAQECIDAQSPPNYSDILTAAIVNQAQWFQDQNEFNQQPPATTLTAALILPNPGGSAVLLLAHLGDSRAYLKGEKRCHQLTTDHTNTTPVTLPDGTTTPRTSVTRTFPAQATNPGKIETTRTHISFNALCKGPLALFVCTDGVWGPLGLGSTPDPADLNYSAKDLVQRAVNQAGDQADNATAMIIPLQPLLVAPPA